MTTGDQHNAAPIEDLSAPARQASVTLRSRAQADDPATQLDPANQSLAEALKLVYGLLKVGMLVLFAIFIFSGFQTVRETESGIRVIFGKPTGDPLAPGFQFALPYPLGELIRVDTGTTQLDIDSAFWPGITDEQRRMTVTQLVSAHQPHQLRPGSDGYLLTGDGKIVHTQWRVIYHRRDPVRFIQNVDPDSEENMVRGAVMRGILQAVSEVTLDDFLLQASEQGSVAMRARELAQRMLDRVDSGIDIQNLTLEQRLPPFWLHNDFVGVQAAEQRAQQARDSAEERADNTLSAMAGPAYPYLIEKIDRYEEAIALEDVEEQERLMGVIRDLLSGNEVDIHGEMIAGQVSGKVTSILSDARRYRSSIVSQRQGELEAFRAKLQQFRRNPEVVIQREWADAMSVFLDHDFVEIFNLPPGVDYAELWINRDIDFQRLADQVRKERENLEQMERRRRDMEERRFRTDTHQQTVSEM